MVQMNLMTAVIVIGAFERVDDEKDFMKAAQADKKMRLVRELRKMFLRLDEDESGTATLDEIQASAHVLKHAFKHTHNWEPMLRRPRRVRPAEVTSRPGRVLGCWYCGHPWVQRRPR